MPALHNLAALGCAAAICLGLSTLGAARHVSLDDLSPARLFASLNKSAFDAQVMQPAGDHAPDVSSVEPRRSLDYWRESNERRQAGSEQGAFVMRPRAPRPVTPKRLAYERELFSREVKDNMLVARTPAEMNRRIADAHGGIAAENKLHDGKGQDGKGHGSVAETESARLANASMDTRPAHAGAAKPKKKRIARSRQHDRMPLMAFSPRFGNPFSIW